MIPSLGADNSVVTVCPRPNGLPMAITHSPTRNLLESPTATAGRSFFASILISATSVFGCGR